MIEQRNPFVSVCIANYNGDAFIGECIEAVLNQANAPSFEIIVHDDASTDNSVATIRAFPAIRLLRSSTNVGFCVSNNRMATAAKGRYLLLLNNDTVLQQDALNALAESAANSFDDPVLSLAQFDYDSDILLDRGFFLDPFANPVPVIESTRNDRAMVMGSCLWISRTLWQRVGGFPEFMQSIGEDLYLCCYARMLGHGVRVCARSSYRHRVGQSFGGGKVRNTRLETTITRRTLSERNKMFVLLIFLPLPLLLLIIPLHTLFLLAEGAAISIWHRDPKLIARIHIAALVAPCFRRQELLCLRHHAQRERVITWRRFLAPTIWIPWKLRLLWRHGIPSVR